MRKLILKNGLTVIYEHRPLDCITVQLCIKVGSNSESKVNLGIAHFIEHLLFEGTKRRPNSELIAKEIERFGGEFNAYTCDERTCYYVKIMNKHSEIALDVLSDMVRNSLFKVKSIEQERKIILDEIKMITDEPRNHQWIIFKDTLFQNHPVKYPTYGTVKTINKISQSSILDFFNKYYVPQNMVLVIVGNWIGESVFESVEKYFGKGNKTNRIVKLVHQEPLLLSKVSKRELRKVNSSYIVIGFKTPPRGNVDSYVLDLIRVILGGGQSSWLFQEIRVKSRLGYEVGAYHECETDYGFFAIHLVTNKNNITKALTLILKQFRRLQKVSPKQLLDAQNYLEGFHKVRDEDSQFRADNLCYWEQIAGVETENDYFKKIKAVTIKDIQKVAKNYLGVNYAIARIEQAI